MADLTTQSKTYGGTAIYPVHARSVSGLLKRVEPLLTPDKLLSRFLKGIPLVFPNGDSYSSDDLKDRIMVAMNEAEGVLKCTVTREQFQEKPAFDYNLYKSYIHIVSEHGPIISVEQLAIVSSDGNNVFEIPPTWIEAANFSKRLINVIPLLAAYGINSVSGSAPGNAGVAFLTMLDGLQWVPAYWQITYTAGVSSNEGQVPVLVNELIGCIAAIDILSEIAQTNIYTSQSLSQDGIAQASSGPGPRVYEKRIEDLMIKKDTLSKQLKTIFSSRYAISNI